MTFNINLTLSDYTIYKLNCEVFEKDNQIYVHYNFTGGNLTAYKKMPKAELNFANVTIKD